jgi:DNA-binding transcriptional regulator YiaG
MKTLTREFRGAAAAKILWTAERVKRLRGHRTQETFGRLIGVPKNTVWRWEAGYSRPDTKRSQKLSRLAKAEKFQMDWKLAGSMELLGDIEEGSRLLAKFLGFSSFRMAEKKEWNFGSI